MSSQQKPERIHTVVIGAGQAGLSVGHSLQARGVDFVIIDANERIGDAWRHRWDSLRLFTPAKFDGLAGLPFPAPPNSFPTKGEMADYLESYATHFSLPVRTSTRVTRLTKSGESFVVETTRGTYEATEVVVAMATYQVPVTPSFAGELDPRIRQIQSIDYRNPEQLAEGDVLIVGAGNSGAEIALDVKAGRRVWLAGPRHRRGAVPHRRPRGTAAARAVAAARRLPLPHDGGHAHRPSRASESVAPRGSAHPHASRRADQSGHRPRPAGDGRDGRPAGARRRTRSGLGAQRDLVHRISAGLRVDRPADFRSAGRSAPPPGDRHGCTGLYFVGLNFLYAFSSTMIHGVSRDAERIANAIAARRSTTAEHAGRVTIPSGTRLAARV